jgi:hypothetical protein
MFQLDDKFLADIGMADMPEEQKKPFLKHIYDELEGRVGQQLSDGMSDEQLEEFENIVEHKDEIITAWLAQHAPDYQNDQAFGRIQTVTKLDANDPNLRAEYAATKWLEVNRPDYRDVVASVLEQIKKEITDNRDKLLSDQPQAPAL